MVKSTHAPHKERISAWTNPWLIAIGLGLTLVGLPMVLWLMSYHSNDAVSMFVITWVCMTMFVLVMAKNSLSDSRYYVDKKVVDQTRKEIESHRITIRKELLKKEIEVLSNGQSTPVLDVWRLDQSLRKRHPYFSSTEALLIDPQIRELQILIQIGELEHSEEAVKQLDRTILSDTFAYLTIIAHDQYLAMLKRFFDRIVLQIDALREDERHVDIPYPILSLLAENIVVFSLTSAQGSDPAKLLKIGDLRFDEGREIWPHRIIDSSSSARSK